MTGTVTPILGLNKPAKGDFDWDEPLNENWDKLDALGAGRLPFMAPLLMDHVMDSEDSVGWALQGSELDGDVYTTAWTKLLAAKNRASSQTLTYKGLIFEVLVDSITKWRFVAKEVYDNAKTNLGNSLGFVVDYVEGAKRIILPYRTGFLSLADEPGVYTSEGLPNITGSVTTRVYGETPTGVNVDGCFYGSNITSYTAPDGGYDRIGSKSTTANFDASRSNSIYGSSSHVTPENTTMYLYYRVANTVNMQASIDIASVLSQLSALEDRIAALEGENE